MVEEQAEAIQQRQALVQMFMAGYYDGKRYKKITDERNKEAIKAFEKRFIKPIEEDVEIEVANMEKRNKKGRGGRRKKNG